MFANKFMGEQALRSAVFRGEYKTVVDLVSAHHVDTKCVCSMGLSLAHIAAASGHLQILKFLVPKLTAADNGCKVRRTPLYLAAKEGHVDVVRYLLEHQADPRKCCQQGYTPRTMARKNRHWKIAAILTVQLKCLPQVVAAKSKRTPQVNKNRTDAMCALGGDLSALLGRTR